MLTYLIITILIVFAVLVYDILTGRVGSALQYLRDRTGAIYLAVKEKVDFLIKCFKG